MEVNVIKFVTDKETLIPQFHSSNFFCNVVGDDPKDDTSTRREH